jgi:hypothetical protein
MLTEILISYADRYWSKQRQTHEGLKNLLYSGIINTEMTFILKAVTEENQEYMKSSERLMQKWYRYSNFVLKIMTEEFHDRPRIENGWERSEPSEYNV